MGPSEAVLGLDARYPAQPPQVAAIRRAVSAVARRGGADVETLIRLELAVSEAATNVVLHAYRKPGARGHIHVTACVDRETVDVTVRDDGCGMAPRPDSPGMGLGLSLMASEADGFAVRSVDGGGTEVNMSFALSAPAGPVPRRLAAPRPVAGERATV